VQAHAARALRWLLRSQFWVAAGRRCPSRL